MGGQSISILMLVAPEDRQLSPHVDLDAADADAVERGRELLALAVPLQVPAHGVGVVIEAEASHGMADVVAVDGLAPLPAAPLGGLAGDEADELRGALLDGLLGALGYLSLRWDGFLHDPPNVGDRQEVVVVVPNRPTTVAIPSRG